MRSMLSSVAFAAAVLLGSVAPAAALQLVVPLYGVGNSPQKGRAVLNDLPGLPHRVRVSLTVAPEPPLAVEPSHIHRGVCGSNGPILRPLHNVVGGTSPAIVIFGFTVAQLHAMGTYINVHKSPAALPIIVSCGNI